MTSKNEKSDDDRASDACYLRFEPSLAQRIESARTRAAKDEGGHVSRAAFVRRLVVRGLRQVEGSDE